MNLPRNRHTIFAALGPLSLLMGLSRPAVAEQPDLLSRLVKRMVVENAPRTYEKLDGWGRTKEIVSGLKVWRDGLRIKTKRRRKQVKHGTWKWYQVRLMNPEQDLHIEIRRLPDAADEALRFDVTVTARLHAFGRLQEWNRGVRVASISTDADVLVSLRLLCGLGVEFDVGRFPPDVQLSPRVEQAELELLDLDVQRISHLRGSLAEELGRGLRGAVQEKLDDSEAKLVQKMNAKLAQRRERFRLSLTDWAKSKWSELSQSAKQE